MTVNRIYIYKRFERFCHWTQAALIIFLAITGFEIHDSFHIFGFQKKGTPYFILALFHREVLSFTVS